MSLRKSVSVILVLFVILFFGGCSAENDGLGGEDDIKESPIADIGDTQSKDLLTLKGAWIATVWNIDFPSKATTNSNQLKSEIDKIVSNAAASGFNALFLQVRPCADSLYKSDIFPWSRFLTGTQGLAPNNSFDPLDYFINKCHAEQIQLHAWLNPYRITASSSDVLHSNHPARIFPETSIRVNDKLYFNPGNPLAQEFVVEGVREIVQNYDIDGIHYDDYFYPEGITDEDLSTFLEHGIGFGSLADWRRNNVDELIRRTYEAVKEISPNVVFGVSPSGIWANKSSNTLGSDTRGFESYNAIYADSRGWVKKGYVDYICPQLYWYIGQSGCDFLTMIKWWQNVCKDTGVTLFIGLAGYKIGTGGKWDDPNEFQSQLELSCSLADGFIVFSFSDVA